MAKPVNFGFVSVIWVVFRPFKSIIYIINLAISNWMAGGTAAGEFLLKMEIQQGFYRSSNKLGTFHINTFSRKPQLRRVQDVWIRACYIEPSPSFTPSSTLEDQVEVGKPLLEIREPKEVWNFGLTTDRVLSELTYVWGPIGFEPSTLSPGLYCLMETPLVYFLQQIGIPYPFSCFLPFNLSFRRLGLSRKTRYRSSHSTHCAY